MQEALRSGQQFDRLYVSQGRRGKAVHDILELAKTRRLDVRFEPWERLRLAAEAAQSHQGWWGLLRQLPILRSKIS